MKYNSIIVLGPTASGKTALSLELCKKYNGEIISADSMQIYRGFDIGTAKATADEQMVAKHHMIDILDCNDSFSVSDYKKMALGIAKDLIMSHKTPVIVGGTGFYIKSLLYDYDYGNAEKSNEIRAELERFLASNGKTALHKMLEECDSESAKKIHENDTKKVMRAIEIYRISGNKKSDQTIKKADNILKPLIIGLNMEREKLYSRINKRVDIMIENGLIDEIKTLLNSGANTNSQAFSSIGYKEFIPYLNGQASLEYVSEQIKQNSRRYAKRQLTFFRAMEDIHWFDMSAPITDILNDIDSLMM